ncbi:MAG: Glycosyltransferase [Parcubacteria group bacterium GW2011_GWA1_40_21]|nr:MAG: putative glycosyltransferase [Parcubacteria group bacterium GW2011_GWC1_40_13]KKR54181.1 MAG: Glycosyltransferase [Parcubacteria group bacterium GW2011_GWA1_40_21]
MRKEREKNICNLLDKANFENGSLRVLVIGTDRNIFKAGSAVRDRMIEYGKLFQQLHIIIFTKRFQKFKSEKISENVWIYPTKSWTRLCYPFGAVRVAKREFGELLPEMIDVVSAQDPFETGIAGWLIARKFHLPLQLQIHTDFLSPYFWKESFLNKIRVIIGKFLVKRADCLRVVSNRIKNSLLKSKTFPPRLQPSITVLPIFVDTDKIRNTPTNFDVRKKYPQFSFIIMMASRLEKEKNINLAIEAMKDLARSYPKIGMVIVGDGKEKKNLERLAAKYSLQKNIIFEGWQNDLISYYKTANVFLSTSLYEGYGLTIVEALASGCPVVFSDVGIASEVISEGESGFVCSVNDKNCFARRIQEIMEIPGLKERLGINSKMSISEKLVATKEEYLSKYKQAMEECLKKDTER